MDTATTLVRRLQCKHCPAATNSSIDVARIAGWRMFTGLSVTGKPLDDVVCPVCAGTAEPEPPRWRVRCLTCDWEASDDDGWIDEDDLTTALDAKHMARAHECMPQVEIGPPGGTDWYHPNDITDGGGLRRPKIVNVDLSATPLPGVRR